MIVLTYHAIEIWRDSVIPGENLFRLFVPLAFEEDGIMTFSSPKKTSEEYTKLTIRDAIEKARAIQKTEYFDQLPVIIGLDGEVIRIENDNEAVEAILRFS